MFSCTNPRKDLVEVENDYEIDLTKLDSVRENLNGFWILENQIDGENILWLNYHKEKNLTIWEAIPYNSKIKRTQILPNNSCPTIARLLFINGRVQMEFVNLSSSDTTEIEYLTKTKFKIDGTSYLRHKGYDFLKSWNMYGSEDKN